MARIKPFACKTARCRSSSSPPRCVCGRPVRSQSPPTFRSNREPATKAAKIQVWRNQQPARINKARRVRNTHNLRITIRNPTPQGMALHGRQITPAPVEPQSREEFVPLSQPSPQVQAPIKSPPFELYPSPTSRPTSPKYTASAWTTPWSPASPRYEGIPTPVGLRSPTSPTYGPRSLTSPTYHEAPIPSSRPALDQPLLNFFVPLSPPILTGHPVQDPVGMSQHVERLETDLARAHARIGELDRQVEYLLAEVRKLQK